MEEQLLVGTHGMGQICESALRNTESSAVPQASATNELEEPYWVVLERGLWSFVKSGQRSLSKTLLSRKHPSDMRSVKTSLTDSSQVRESFRRQRIMKHLGARISKLERGLVEISAVNRIQLSQQDGFVHAGVLVSLADSAGGYATLSLLPKGSRVLSVELKMNFLRPANGKVIRAQGRVKKIGKTIAVCELDAATREKGSWTTCAWGSQTVYCIRPLIETPDLPRGGEASPLG